MMPPILFDMERVRESLRRLTRLIDELRAVVRATRRLLWSVGGLLMTIQELGTHHLL
jgi:hypothetical protein